MNISYILASITILKHQRWLRPAVTCSIIKGSATHFRPTGRQIRREAFPDHIQGQVRNGRERSGLDQLVLYLPLRNQAAGAIKWPTTCVPIPAFTGSYFGWYLVHLQMLKNLWMEMLRWREIFFRELRQWNMNNGERGNVRGLPQYQSINTQYTYIVYW